MYIGLPNLGLSGYHSVYAELEAQAIAAARRNGAALWYVGNDPTGFVFEDSVGTLPATGTDPVGLLLDRSYGTSNLGPELLPNPGNPFTSTANLSFAGGGSGAIVSGDLQLSGNGTGIAQVLQVFPVVVGKTYKATFTIRRGTSASSAVVVVQNAAASPVTANYTNATTSNVSYTVYFTALATENYRFMLFINSGAASGTVFASSFSCAEVLGYSALQTTAGNRPTLELQANGYYGMRFDGVTDTLNTAVIQTAVGNWTSIASASVPDFAAVYPFYSTRGATATPITGLIRTSLTANTEMVERNDASTLAILASTGTVIANTPFTIGGTVSGGVSNLFVNGVLGNTGGAISGAVTLTSGYIGSNGAAGGFAKGLIFLVCASPAAMPTADRIAIERFAALLSGASYS